MSEEPLAAPSHVLQKRILYSISQDEGTPKRVPLLISQLRIGSKGRILNILVFVVLLIGG